MGDWGHFHKTSEVMFLVIFFCKRRLVYSAIMQIICMKSYEKLIYEVFVKATQFFIITSSL